MPTAQEEVCSDVSVCECDLDPALVPNQITLLFVWCPQLKPHITHIHTLRYVRNETLLQEIFHI